MVKIKQQLVTSRAKTYPGLNGKKYITIHETANTSRGANAQAHANLQTKGFSASWHYTVDDKQTIQSFPDDVRCWHAGDGSGNGNYHSIGIEICVNSDGDFNKAVANAAELVKILMARHNIPLGNVVQHNRWSGKNCPANLRSGKVVSWSGFIHLVQQKPVADVPAAPKEVDEMAEKLPKTQQDDMRTLLQRAFDDKVFKVNHVSKVPTMTRGQATDLLISYVARTSK